MDMHIHVCTCTYMYMYMHIHVHVHVHVCARYVCTYAACTCIECFHLLCLTLLCLHVHICHKSIGICTCTCTSGLCQHDACCVIVNCLVREYTNVMLHIPFHIGYIYIDALLFSSKQLCVCAFCKQSLYLSTKMNLQPQM